MLTCGELNFRIERNPRERPTFKYQLTLTYTNMRNVEKKSLLSLEKKTVRRLTKDDQTRFKEGDSPAGIVSHCASIAANLVGW